MPNDIYFGISSESFVSTRPGIRDAHELIIIASGRVEHVINTKSALKNAGDVCFVRREDQHYFRPDGSGRATIINICIPDALCLQLFDLFGFKRELLSGKIPYSGHFPEYVNFQKEIIRYSPPELRLLTANLLHALMNTADAAAAAGWLSELIAEMRQKENFAAGVTRLYELSNYSKEHVCREIHRHYGKTPSQLINEIRLEYIAKLLSCSDTEIIDIAFECGYNNLSHFYHLFKERYGISPAKYRALGSTPAKRTGE